MARIKNRNDFKCYVLRKLGAPVLDLVLETDLIDDCETPATTAACVTGTSGTSGTCITGTSGITGTDTISTTGVGTTGVGTTGTSGITGSRVVGECVDFSKSVCTQLDLAIDDALDYFHQNASNLGNEKALLTVKLEKGQMFYDIPECVVSIQQDISRGASYTFDAEEGAEAVGLFSLQSQFGPRGVFSHMGGSGGHDALLTYEIAQQFNSLVNLRYTQKFITEFNELAHKLFITPTPDNSDLNRMLVYECNTKVADEFCFNHLWVQRYATALTMEQIGRNLSMYTGMQLPGGGEFNANFYWDMGLQEKDKLEEELFTGKWGNAVAGGFFITG
jgi:hypothetical protein